MKRVLKWISNPSLMVYSTFWLIVLTVIGTIAQKYTGLFLAQQKYFSTWVIEGLAVPLPGGRLAMAVILAGLIARLLLERRWVMRLLGIHIVHIGAILLLLGGFLTAYFSVEGNMVIQEGRSAGHFSHDYNVELAVIETSDPKFDSVTAFAQGWLKEGTEITDPDLPFRAEVKTFLANCAVQDKAGVDSSQGAGVGHEWVLNARPLETEYEQNRAGVVLEVSGPDLEEPRVLTLSEHMTAAPVLEAGGKRYQFIIRRERFPLPFELALLDFEKTVHPGTDTARSYHSEVHVVEGPTNRRALIEMNEPLRHRGYTFYQASFIDGVPETTILAVVKNYGRLFPYISSLIMAFGLLFHLVYQLAKSGPRRVPATASAAVLALLAGAAFLTGAQPAGASEESPHLEAFRGIAVQHEGRLKPVDTMARHFLLAVYERSALEDESAVEWFWELMVDPEASYEKQVFRIRQPDVLAALSLPENEAHLYSYSELSAAMQKILPTLHKLHTREREERSLVENQLVDLYIKSLRILRLSRSLSGLVPAIQTDNAAVAGKLGMEPGKPVSYLHFIRIREQVHGIVNDLNSKVHEDFTDEDRELERIIRQLNTILRDREARDFTILPPEDGSKESSWLAPWALMDGRDLDERDDRALAALEDALAEYHRGHRGNSGAAAARLDEFRELVSQRLRSPKVDSRIALEVRDNELGLFRKSQYFYIGAFLLWCLAALVRPARKLVGRLAFAVFGVGCLLHLGGLVMRMVIMNRPPVSTLYESIIFVGFIGAFFCLLLEWRKKTGLGLLAGVVIGATLHFIGFSYASEGDTKGMLVAVLNSNFWLATHVVTITIGYGATLVAGIFGHLYLWQKIRHPHDKPRLNDCNRTMLGVAGVALFFTLFGTILGGIWADQSWGRFWGWDPKENGALLIVLWLVLLLHARVAGHMKATAFAAGLVIANIVVALAWFGVNLLNVGLHSYGFTEGLTRNLAIFCGGEFALAVVGYVAATLRGKTREKAAAPLAEEASPA